MNDRRCKVIEVSTHFLADHFSAGVKHFEVTDDAIPKDGTIVGVQFDGFGTIKLLVESEEFPPVPEGMPYPTLSPQMRDAREG